MHYASEANSSAASTFAREICQEPPVRPFFDVHGAVSHPRAVWSMPGGFSSMGGGGGREGYQNLDSNYDVETAAPPPPKRNIPTTPLSATNGAAPPPPPGPIGGGYQAQ